MITALVAMAPLSPTATSAATRPTHAWDVQAPVLTVFIGGVSFNDWPVCRPNQVQVAARTRSSTYAVLGVVSLHGRHCTLNVDHAVVGLLDSHGQKLDIPVLTPPWIDLGTPDRPDLAWDNGKGIWGFAWRGSWCGASAAYVQVELRGGHLIRGPISGPQPSCDASAATDPLIERGVPAWPGSAVQPAPLEWSNLTASLQVPPIVDGTDLTGVVVTLTNASDSPVSLDPCPLYSLLVRNKRGDGGDAATDRPLVCGDATPAVVPALGNLHLELPPMNIYRGDYGKRAQTVTVTFGMAGVAVATANMRLSAET